MTRGRRFFTCSFRVDVRDDPRPKVHGSGFASHGGWRSTTGVGAEAVERSPLEPVPHEGGKKGHPRGEDPHDAEARRPVAIGMKTAMFVSAGISQTRPDGSDSKAFTLNGLAPALPAD